MITRTRAPDKTAAIREYLEPDTTFPFASLWSASFHGDEHVVCLQVEPERERKSIMLLYLVVAVHAVIGQFYRPFSIVWPAKIWSCSQISCKPHLALHGNFQILVFPQGHKSKGKNSVCNFWYGPHTCLVRGINWALLYELNKRFFSDKWFKLQNYVVVNPPEFNLKNREFIFIMSFSEGFFFR